MKDAPHGNLMTVSRGPPYGQEGIARAVERLGYAMTWVGAFGALVCYFGSFFGRLGVLFGV